MPLIRCISNSGGSRPDVWGEQSSNGAPKSIHLFRYPSFSATIVGYHTKVVTFSRPRKWIFLLVELEDYSVGYKTSDIGLKDYYPNTD